MGPTCIVHHVSSSAFFHEELGGNKANRIQRCTTKSDHTSKSSSSQRGANQLHVVEHHHIVLDIFKLLNV